MKKTGVYEKEQIKNKIVIEKMTKEDEKEIDEIEDFENNRKTTDILKNLKLINKPVTEIDEDENLDILETDKVSAIKVVLRISVLRKGFKNVDEYARTSQSGYSYATIRMAFSNSHKTSDNVLLTIAKELDVELAIEEKKIYRISQ